MIAEEERLQLISLASRLLREIAKDIENQDMEALYRKLEDWSTDPHILDLHIAVSKELRNLGYDSLGEVFRDICREDQE